LRFGLLQRVGPHSAHRATQALQRSWNARLRYHLTKLRSTYHSTEKRYRRCVPLTIGANPSTKIRRVPQQHPGALVSTLQATRCNIHQRNVLYIRSRRISMRSAKCRILDPRHSSEARHLSQMPMSHKANGPFLRAFRRQYLLPPGRYPRRPRSAIACVRAEIPPILKFDDEKDGLRARNRSGSVSSPNPKRQASGGFWHLPSTTR
jgi:hypothetical protein